MGWSRRVPMGCGRWWSFDVEVYTSSTSTGFWAGFVTEWGRGPSRLCCIRTDEQTNHKHRRGSTIIHTWCYGNDHQHTKGEMLTTLVVHLIAERRKVHWFAVSVSHTCCCLREVVPCLIGEGLVRSKQAHLFSYVFPWYQVTGC